MSEQPDNQNIKKALQLCSDGFLQNFSDEFLQEITLEPWQRELGPKDNLYRAPKAHYFSLFVDAEISYCKNHILAWLSKVSLGGYLILEAVKYITVEEIERICSDVVRYIPNNNHNVWIFRKKSVADLVRMVDGLLGNAQHRRSDNEVLQTAANAERYDPHLSGLVGFLLAKLRIYKKYDLDQLALDECRQAVEANPLPNTKIIVTLCQLAYGDVFYQQGFATRKTILDNAPNFSRTPYPPKAEWQHQRWNGEDVSGKTIVIWTEFGLGDEIMFSQLAYYFKYKHAAKVIMVAQEAVADLIGTSADIDQVVLPARIEQELPEFDYWVYPHDILAYIEVPFSQVPKRTPHLFVRPEQQAQYRPLFADNGKLKVGIVWRGNPTHENDSYRSIHDLEKIKSLFDMENIDWYCFQKNCNEQEQQLLQQYGIPQITKDFESCAQTAAAMKNLDYFVSVDTSTAHIAGAIGIPTLLLLPYYIDWRWGLIESSNYWYPNMRSFRCPLPSSDWTAAITELQQALSCLKKA